MSRRSAEAERTLGEGYRTIVDRHRGEQERLQRLNKIIWLSAVFIGVIVTCWAIVAVIALYVSSYERDSWGLFGDSFGAVNAIVGSVTLVGVILALVQGQKSVTMQRHEMELQRREMQDSRKEFREIAKATHAQNERMKSDLEHVRIMAAIQAVVSRSSEWQSTPRGSLRLGRLGHEMLGHSDSLSLYNILDISALLDVMARDALAQNNDVRVRLEEYCPDWDKALAQAYEKNSDLVDDIADLALLISKCESLGKPEVNSLALSAHVQLSERLVMASCYCHGAKHEFRGNNFENISVLIRKEQPRDGLARVKVALNKNHG